MQQILMYRMQESVCIFHPFRAPSGSLRPSGFDAFPFFDAPGRSVQDG